MTTESLNSRIKNAKSLEEIKVLLAEGEGCRLARPSTRRRWASNAAERRAQLEANDK